MIERRHQHSNKNSQISVPGFSLLTGWQRLKLSNIKHKSTTQNEIGFMNKSEELGPHPRFPYLLSEGWCGVGGEENVPTGSEGNRKLKLAGEP